MSFLESWLKSVIDNPLNFLLTGLTSDLFNKLMYGIFEKTKGMMSMNILNHTCKVVVAGILITSLIVWNSLVGKAPRSLF